MVEETVVCPCGVLTWRGPCDEGQNMMRSGGVLRVSRHVLTVVANGVPEAKKREVARAKTPALVAKPVVQASREREDVRDRGCV